MSNGSNEIQLISPGTATFGVDHYEYFVSQSSVTPSSSATATGTTNGTLSLSSINYGHFYVWYRTVSTKGTKSTWSNSAEVNKIFTITLDNQSATTAGTASIFEFYNHGYYLDNNLTNQMTTSTNNITVPTKTGYLLYGYYTGVNCAGTRYINNEGYLTSAASNTIFGGNGSLYACWKDATLYNVMELETTNGTYAKQYTGTHKDTLDNSGTNNIYYWFANNTTNGNKINNDLRNVILGGHCWQMIRTTDSGGVKLLYNGVAENDQCLTTRGTHEGYNGNRSSQKLSTANYYYGTDYTYDVSTNKFTLSGTLDNSVVWSSSTYESLIGKYTCINTSANGTCSTLYLVESFNSNTNANCIPLEGNQQYNIYGKVKYNAIINSLAHLGYMYNTAYTNQVCGTTDEVINTKSVTTSNSFYYGDKIVKSGNYYYIENTDGTTPTKTQWTNSSADASLVGLYSCYNADTGNVTNYNGVTIPNGTRCTTAYYILDTTTTANTIYHQKMIDNITNGTTNITLSTGFVDNQNGTYSLNTSGLTTISRMSYYTNYATYKTYYYCSDYTSTTCSKENMRYISDTNKNNITYRGEYLYGSGFEYVNGNYVLQNTISLFTTNLTANNLNNHHYSCFNTTGECQTINFIYGFVDVNTIRYISITGGKDIDDARNEMLHNNDVNAKSSTIKFAAEAWYKKYMLPYQSLLENPVFCFNREELNPPNNPYNLRVNGWYSNGNVSQTLDVSDSAMTGKTLACNNITDQFNTQNSLARTNYPVGLLNDYETYLLSGVLSESTIRSYNYTDTQGYWLGSVKNIQLTNNTYPQGWRVAPAGSLHGNYVGGNYGLRVVVSSNPNAKIISGNGSLTSPYKIAISN